MDYFKAGYGLITEQDQNTENCNLFYAQWLILIQQKVDILDRNFFEENMKLKTGKSGLYNRRSNDDDYRSVSQDEMLGWFVSSSILGTLHAEQLWKHLITHFGTYNNTSERFPLPFNLGNFYSWGSMVDSPLRWIFLPVYLINLIISVNKPKLTTSSKIMYWMELELMPSSWINRRIASYFIKKMKKQYGNSWLIGLYEIYFPKENRDTFPLWVEVKNYDTLLSDRG